MILQSNLSFVILWHRKFCFLNHIINSQGISFIDLREMLTDVLKVMINNPFKENFYRKRKKINVLTFFFFSISYKSGVKTFLK